MARERTRAGSIGTRLALLAFSAVFAVAFGVFGYTYGLRPLASTLRLAWEVQHRWQPVQAEVLSAELRREARRSGSGTGPAFEVQARYRYAVDGKPHEGTRVGLDPAGHGESMDFDGWQRRWLAQLQGARTSGHTVTAWVNPVNPSQSLIDPAIRWRLQLFRLPFALVFTGVGLVAAWVFVVVLLRWRKMAREEADAASLSDGPVPPPGNPARRSLGILWLIALFWCGFSVPLAALLWPDPHIPWLAKGVVGLCALVGIGLLWYSGHVTYLAWRYAGTGLALQPARPLAGHPVEVALVVPARAAPRMQGHSLQLRLAQYRVDEASSGSPERRVESFAEPVAMQPASGGRLRLVARFLVPPDAPTSGARRSGERVEWRLDLLRTPQGEPELTCDVPVQAAAQPLSGDPPDRFDRRAAWKGTPVPVSARPAGSGAEQDDEAPMFLPPAVTLQETRHAWHFVFRPGGWTWAAGIVLVNLALGAVALDGLGVSLAAGWRTPAAAGAGWALAVALLHAASRRWTLTVQDAGLIVQRRSWLWSHARAVPGEATQALVRALQRVTGSGPSEEAYFALYAPVPEGGRVRLTPGIAGTEAATAVGQAIAQAWRVRQGHFTPGSQRPALTGHSRPTWGALAALAALAWCLWGG